MLPLSSWVAASRRAGGHHTLGSADGPSPRETLEKCGSGFRAERKSKLFCDAVISYSQLDIFVLVLYRIRS